MRMSENEPCGKSMPVDKPAKYPGHDGRPVLGEGLYCDETSSNDVEAKEQFLWPCVFMCNIVILFVSL